MLKITYKPIRHLTGKAIIKCPITVFCLYMSYRLASECVLYGRFSNAESLPLTAFCPSPLSKVMDSSHVRKVAVPLQNSAKNLKNY